MLILGDKIAKIEEAGGMPEIPFLLPEDVIDGSDRILTPGFIDCHVHVLGGGGEEDLPIAHRKRRWKG